MVLKARKRNHKIETPCFESNMCHLVVRLSEVIQAGDVFQKHTKLCRQMFEH